LKAGFFSGLKTRWNDSPQTLNQVFLAMFSPVSQLKNTIVGLVGSQEMRFESGHDLYKNEEQPLGDCYKEFFPSRQAIKQLRRHFCT